MAKELTGKERRKKILSIMEQSERPLSGTVLGKSTGVSRQVVVQDIALLRTEGHPIISTARGYCLEKSDFSYRTIKVCHTDAQLEEELNTIVDLGGTVCSVIINHRIYGQVTAELNVKNRRDVQRFLDDLRTGKSTPLLNITSGYHYHKIKAESQDILDEIENALEKKGFLAEKLPYEEIQ